MALLEHILYSIKLAFEYLQLVLGDARNCNDHVLQAILLSLEDLLLVPKFSKSFFQFLIFILYDLHLLKLPLCVTIIVHFLLKYVQLLLKSLQFLLFLLEHLFVFLGAIVQFFLQID